LIVEARAKINLALDILHKRSDGYHEVEMVMQTIALADEVSLDERTEGIVIETNMPELDCGPSNIAYRAAALVADRCGVRQGVRIFLNKKIPLAAGLAGGSADAAAVLTGLNNLWRLGLSIKELENMGGLLGSDVPFCLNGGTMLATGRGETLSPLPPLPHVYIVLAKPQVAVSTAWAYQNYQQSRVGLRPDIRGMVTSLLENDIAGVARRMANVLETVTIPVHDEIAELKNMMLKNGLVASMMSGSGPSVFGLANDYRQACNVAEQLRHYTAGWVTVTESVNAGGEKWNAGYRR